MLIDTDLLFDDLTGYEFYHKGNAKAVIDEKVKLFDSSTLTFCERVEYLIEECDELIILRSRQTIEDIERFISFLIDIGEPHLTALPEQNLEVARRDGVYETFTCLHNGKVYDLDSFIFME